MDPALLRTFLAVADAEKISAAVKFLHLSQPAITAQIHKLEESLGTPLFVRSVQGVRLTAKGRRLYVFACEIEQLVRKAEGVVAESKEQAGHLRIAASTTTGSYVLPGPLAAFRRLNPNISIELIIDNGENVLRRVREGICPIGLVEGLARAPQVHLVPFVDDELVLIRSADVVKSGLSQRLLSVCSAHDLLDMPLIWRESGSGTRAVVERALRKAGLPMRKLKYEVIMGGPEAINNSVIAGLGVTFMSRWIVQSDLTHGRLAIIPLTDLKITRSFHWVLPNGAMSAPVSNLIQFLKSSPPSLT